MNTTLSDCLTYLRELTRDGADTDTAVTRLRALRARHRSANLELVWEMASDGRPDFQLLLGPAEGATTCLSVVPETTSPFVMRGAQRWPEAQLATINGRPLFVQDVMITVDAIWNDARLLERIVDAQLLARRLDEDVIEVSEAALQTAVDRFRSERDLDDPAVTQQWLDDHGLTLADLEIRLERELAMDALRQRMVEADAASHFRADPARYDTVAVVAFPVPDARRALQLVDEIAAGAAWLEVAEQALTTRPGAPRAERSMVFESFPRAAIEPLTDTALEAGAVLAARFDGRGPYVSRVRTVETAVWNDITRRRIEGELFDRWLAQARRDATVTWHWGPG